MTDKEEGKNQYFSPNSSEQQETDNSPPHKNNPLKVIGIILIFILFFALAYYLGTKGYKISINRDQDNISPTHTVRPTEVINLPTVAIEITQSIPTTDAVKLYPNSEIFTSANLGIRFRFAKKTTETKIPAETYSVKEAGNRVYVYFGQSRPESGQYVEVFQKDPADAVNAAIRKQFLVGIPESDCFVKILADKSIPSNFTKATIAYPVPTDATEPAFTYGEKCPQDYSQSNGISYFLLDSNHPDKFLFFSIGQYAIPAELGRETPYWQETIEFLD